jgi:hypothetical protein
MGLCFSKKSVTLNCCALWTYIFAFCDARAVEVGRVSLLAISLYMARRSIVKVVRKRRD